MTEMTLEKALDLWNGEGAAPDTSRLPAHIQERVPQAAEHASVMAEIGNQVDASRVGAFIEAAAASKTTPKRVHYLQRATQSLANIYGPLSACRSRCSHCCHIPVKITQAEAAYLGKKSCRTPAAANALAVEPVIVGYESPCPFLVDSKCSVYEYRPAVCRSHLNMDRDNLLCQLQPGLNVPVPYLDTRPLVAAAFAILGPAQPIADIRQWFPQ